MSFIDYIEEGNLNKAKQFLQENPNYNIHVENDHAFHLSCAKGHLEVAKWLWNISNHKINIHDYYELAFRWSCQKGHFVRVVQWDI